MAREIFVDTGAWVALADGRDHLHSRAKQIFTSVLKPANRLVTTNLVAAESYTLIRRRVGLSGSLRFLASLRTPRLVKVYSDSLIEMEAEQLLRRYSDQDFSFVDSVSFIIMRERHIQEAFAFDDHFRVAGFTLLSLP
jgi:predicted nucleic acid-binding protein